MIYKPKVIVISNSSNSISAEDIKSFNDRAKITDTIIKENRTWYPEEIREFCIFNDFYTRGTRDEYESMLNFVKTNTPTIEAVYAMALDIIEHTAPDEDDAALSAENMMFLINKDLVYRTYEVIT